MNGDILAIKDLL